MLCYRVYCWLYEQSLAAELIEEVWAVSAGHALALVMQTYGLPYVCCAWVVSDQDEALDARCSDAWLLSYEEVQALGEVATLGEVLYVE